MSNRVSDCEFLKKAEILLIRQCGIPKKMNFHLLPFPQHRPRSCWNSAQVAEWTTLPGKSPGGLAGTPTPGAQVLHWWVVGGVWKGTSAHPAAPCSGMGSCQTPSYSLPLSSMFILISDLKRVAQRGTSPQRLLASGTKCFLKNKNFYPETFWLMPQGVARWGHAMACTTRSPWKTSNYFQYFKASKPRTVSCRRSIYTVEGFSPKDIHLGACHHFLKQICWHIGREAQPRPWCCSAHQTLANHLQHSGMGLRHKHSSWCNSYLSEKCWIPCLQGGPNLNSTFPTLFSSVAVTLLHFHISLALSTITFFLPSHVFPNPLTQYLTYPIPSQTNYVFVFKIFQQ